MKSFSDDPDPADRLLESLLAASRANKPNTARQEYGFETRLLANLAERTTIQSLMAPWTWRLAPFFAVLALSLSLWTYLAPQPGPMQNQGRAALSPAPASDDDLSGMVFEDLLAPS